MIYSKCKKFKECSCYLITSTSNRTGLCFYHTNYSKIELLRLKEWQKRLDNAKNMPELSEFQKYERMEIIKDLFKNKSYFVKHGIYPLSV